MKFKIELTKADIIKIKKRKVSPGSIKNAIRSISNCDEYTEVQRKRWGMSELSYLKNKKFLELAKESHPEYFL